MTSSLLTRFSFDLTWSSSFLLQVILFFNDLEINKTNILSKIHGDYLPTVTSLMKEDKDGPKIILGHGHSKKYDLKCVNKFSFDLP